MYFVVYGFFYLFSLLPFSVLYFFSDGIYFFLFYVFGYRRRVVKANLKIAFPEKSEAEIRRISKKVYHNLTDTFMEIIKLISMNEKIFNKRCKGDFSLVEDLVKKGKSVQLHTGHQFNWEFGSLLMSKEIKSCPTYAIYMPIKNTAVERLFLKIRQKYGAIFIKATEFREKRKQMFDERFVIFLAADQNPGDPGSAYWLNYFNKPAPFITGPEVGAIKNDTAVVFVRSRIPKRGHYVLECTLFCENAASTAPGEITRAFRDFLEIIIKEEPDNYLWTHRRWKWDYNEAYKEKWIDTKEV